MQTSALMPIRFAMMERFGDFGNLIFPILLIGGLFFLFSLNIPGGPGQAPFR